MYAYYCPYKRGWGSQVDKREWRAEYPPFKPKIGTLPPFWNERDTPFPWAYKLLSQHIDTNWDF